MSAPVPVLSVCVAVYKRHRAPNLGTLAGDLAAACADVPYELVVTLNGIGARAAGLPDGARSVAFPQNMGVPKAWNAAARAAGGEHLCFVNDDVRLGPGSLALLARALTEHEDAAVVGPTGTQWDVPRARHVAYLPDEPLPAGTARPCDVVSGYLMACRTTVFVQAGGFDEAYSPCGFEEVDLCTTVRRRLGLQCYAVSGVQHEHTFAISSRRPWQRLRWAGGREKLGDIAARNRAHFLAKWGTA